MRDEPATLNCQDCGILLRVLEPEEERKVAANPYNYILYCRDCAREQPDYLP